MRDEPPNAFLEGVTPKQLAVLRSVRTRITTAARVSATMFPTDAMPERDLALDDAVRHLDINVLVPIERRMGYSSPQVRAIRAVLFQLDELRDAYEQEMAVLYERLQAPAHQQQEKSLYSQATEGFDTTVTKPDEDRINVRAIVEQAVNDKGHFLAEHPDEHPKVQLTPVEPPHSAAPRTFTYTCTRPNCGVSRTFLRRADKNKFTDRHAAQHRRDRIKQQNDETETQQSGRTPSPRAQKRGR